jgi:hypothetical protein
VAKVVRDILIFPVYNIFFQEVGTPVAVQVIGFSLNALLQAAAIFGISKVIETKIIKKQ